ncbi:hypothetical protein ABWI00_19810 [Algihabitans albus]|uniref:hypothetical protein n=1 Tax=Algihabitans albus TaxID=2164067 RepID=UPI0035CF3F21
MKPQAKPETKPEAPTELPSVSAVADIQVDHAELDASIARFVGRNPAYYAKAFHRIHDTTRGVPLTFNWAAAVLGPIWAAARGVWGFFWAFLILEIVAWVQIGRGTWGELGADNLAQAERQEGRAQDFLERAEAARLAGEDPSRFRDSGQQPAACGRAQPGGCCRGRGRRDHHTADRIGVAACPQARAGRLGQHRL